MHIKYEYFTDTYLEESKLVFLILKLFYRILVEYFTKKILKYKKYTVVKI